MEEARFSRLYSGLAKKLNVNAKKDSEQQDLKTV